MALRAKFGIAGDLGVERPREAGFGHGSTADDQRLELLPAGGRTLAFPLEQAKALRPQKDAGMLGEHRHWIVGNLGR